MFQKLFKGYIFCFLGRLVGEKIFEQYARETNLKKKRSVRLCNERQIVEIFDMSGHRDELHLNINDYNRQTKIKKCKNYFID